MFKRFMIWWSRQRNMAQGFCPDGCAERKVIGQVYFPPDDRDCGAALSAFIGDSGRIYQCTKCPRRSYPRYMQGCKVVMFNR
jgi:hypothetical protein